MRSISIIYVVAAKAAIHDSVPPVQSGELQTWPKKTEFSREIRWLVVVVDGRLRGHNVSWFIGFTSFGQYAPIGY